MMNILASSAFVVFLLSLKIHFELIFSLLFLCPQTRMVAILGLPAFLVSLSLISTIFWFLYSPSHRDIIVSIPKVLFYLPLPPIDDTKCRSPQTLVHREDTRQRGVARQIQGLVLPD